MEVVVDLHLLGQCFEDIGLKKGVPGLFNRTQIEFLPKMVENRVLVLRFLTVLTQCGDRGPVGAGADEDLEYILSVKAVYLDREFYDSKCLTLLQAHNLAYVMPIVRWGPKIKQELSEGWSRVIDHDLTATLDGHSWTVEFPVYIDCTYLKGRYDEYGVARHGYAADAPFIETSRQARYHYGKRFGIEASYLLSELSIATTTTQETAVRLLYVVVSLFLQNVWRYLHWEYVATPRRGGRRLWSRSLQVH